MPRSSIALATCLVVLGLSACNRATDEPAVIAQDTPANVDDTAAGADSASMRYTCEGGYAVAVFGDTARVTTGGGRITELARDAQASPPVFVGEALSFSVESDGGVIAQDEGRRYPCEEDV